MELLKKRAANLLAVKSIVTIVLTCVFAYLAIAGHVTTDQFLTVFTVVIAFYFGTQAEKRSSQAEGIAELQSGASVLSEQGAVQAGIIWSGRRGDPACRCR